MRSGPAAPASQPHARNGLPGYRTVADIVTLLLIIFDDLRRTNLRFVGVTPDIAKGTSLAQEVPALIQFYLDLPKTFRIGIGGCALLV